MTNYLLSIDPSIKNTGFTLWEKKFIRHITDIKNENEYLGNYYWKPIWITSYSFNKNNDFYLEIKSKVNDLIGITRKIIRFNIIIERGTFHSKNGIGYETQEHLRGFIAGRFNKLLTKDMLISNTEWWSYYEENYKEIIEILTHEIMNNFIKENNIKNININKKIYKKWIIYLKKELSFKLANYLKNTYNWEPIITNHDEADSLLIGWYYLNKENKND